LVGSEVRGDADMKNKSIRIPLLFILAVFVSANAGAQTFQLTRDQAVIDAGGLNDFARENLGSFSVSVLDNGIPVIVKQNASNRILALKTVLVGQTSLVPLDKAGLEAVMLAMLTRGSAKYPYSELQRLLFEKSASISPSYTSFDMSSLDLFTIDAYFDQLFDLYADSFLHPGWNEEEFPRVMNDLKLAKRQAMNDPYTKSVIRVNERFFSGHPYASSWDGTESSLAGITLEEVKSYYEKTVLSGRIFIVAVGNFDTAKLVKKLNASFGAMPKKPFSRPAVPQLGASLASDLILETFPQSEGLAYVRADFALPSPDSPDFPKLQVAFTLLDDVLFEIVRTRHGACYSVWSGIHPFTAGYGDITVYKTSVPGQVKQFVDDSIQVLVSGRCIAGKVSVSAEGKSGIGQEVQAKDQKGVFVPIAEALPFYKKQFLSGFYSGQQSNISVAAEIASSVVYHGDYRDYLLMVDRVNAVGDAEVVRVVQTYMRNNPMLWIALGDEAVLKDVKKESFATFLGK
jgi:zinc protease